MVASWDAVLVQVLQGSSLEPRKPFSNMRLGDKHMHVTHCAVVQVLLKLDRCWM